MINAALGSKQTWDHQIGVDRQQVDALLDLIGTISSKTFNI